MKVALILAFLMGTFSLWAETTPPSRIHELKQDLAFHEVLVFMEGGKVLKLSSEDKELLNFLREAHKEGSYLVIDYDEKRQIQDAKIFPHEEADEKDTGPRTKRGFTPTVFSSFNEVKKMFRAQRGSSLKGSECYQRAHIWSWEAYKNSGINSMKIFLFFTQKFIRENDYEWWFHVSPMVYAKEGGKTVEYVMDKRFLRAPALVPAWKNIFMKGKSCREVSKYSDYSQNQQNEDCYMMKFIMHYYQPKDIEALERFNAVKNFWFDWEIQEAYKLGFGQT